MFTVAKACRFLLAVVLLGVNLDYTSSYAKTLRVGAGGMPPSLGNPYTATALPATELWLAIFDGLTRLDWRGGPLPGLAMSWENPTTTTWRFTLREDMNFHNGRPVTAEAVASVFSLLRSDQAAAFLVTRELDNIVSAEAVDSLTVQITLREPDVILPKRLSIVMIVDPEAWLDKGLMGSLLHPLAAGPIASLIGDREIPWHGLPRLTVVGVHLPDTRILSILLSVIKTSRLQALYGGQVDIATGLGEDDVRDVENNGYVAHVTSTTQIKSIALPNVRDRNHPLKIRESVKRLTMRSTNRPLRTSSWEDGSTLPARVPYLASLDLERSHLNRIRASHPS